MRAYFRKGSKEKWPYDSIDSRRSNRFRHLCASVYFPPVGTAFYLPLEKQSPTVHCLYASFWHSWPTPLATIITLKMDIYPQIGKWNWILGLQLALLGKKISRPLGVSWKDITAGHPRTTEKWEPIWEGSQVKKREMPQWHHLSICVQWCSVKFSVIAFMSCDCPSPFCFLKI